MDTGFSFASVILSYFLVGGGMFTATLVGAELRLSGDIPGYVLLAAGALVGGFVAARASSGQTILEPAIGAVAVVATIVGLAATTPLGKTIWLVAEDQSMKFVGTVGVAGVVGAIVGAFISEKLFGEATQSSVPWFIYTAMAVFGACLLATLFAAIVFVGRGAVAVAERSDNDLLTAILVGMGGGCLLAGTAIGASARTRPLFAAFLGGAVGVAGFFALVTRAQSGNDRDTAIGIAVLAGGGALVTLTGTLFGWRASGRHRAV
jgi:hypothetical protein